MNFKIGDRVKRIVDFRAELVRDKVYTISKILSNPEGNIQLKETQERS